MEGRQNKQKSRSPSAEQYMDLLYKTHWNNLNRVQEIHDMTYMDYAPVILIGQSRTVHYKVVCSTRLQAKDIVTDDRRPLMPKNILGLNANVEPRSNTLRQRRRDNLSTESRDSTESDDYDSNAFHIFHQLGDLMCYTKDFTTDRDAIEDEDHWIDAGFSVVVDITSGKPQGVWLVFDFWPRNFDGDRHHIDNDTEWGWLPPYLHPYDDEWAEQYSVVKIANELRDLGPNHEFTLDHPIYHEVEIVPVVKSSIGVLLRQTVDRKTEYKLPG